MFSQAVLSLFFYFAISNPSIESGSGFRVARSLDTLYNCRDAWLNKDMHTWY